MKFQFTPYIYSIFFLFSVPDLFSQDLILNPQTRSPENNAVLRLTTYQKLNTSEKEIYKQIDSVKNQIYQLGYIYSRTDTVIKTDSVYTCYFILGQQLEKIRIHHHNLLSAGILSQLPGEFTSTYIEIPFQDIKSTMQQIADLLETEGSPFSKVYLQHIDLKSEFPGADLVIDQVDTRNIGKVIVKGYEDFPPSFIKYELDLREGTIFNLEKLKYASAKTQSIPFASEMKSPEVLFTKDSTFVYLNLEKKRSSTFDGLIGFGSKTDGSGIEFNGYLDVKLRNIFNRGESINIYWKSNGNKSQQFDLSAEIPYIFKSPVSPAFSLNIFRQDTTYSNVNFDFKLYLNLLKNARIAALYNSENSSDLQQETVAEEITSYKKNRFGLNLQYFIPLNDVVYHRRFSFDLTGFYGSRKTDLDKTSQFTGVLNARYLWRINPRNAVYFGNQSGIISADILYTNELFRIGGFKSIRGFNEESIFVSAYSIFNLEYRFKTDPGSYLFSITDFAYTENKVVSQNSALYSFGLGYSFLSKAGRIQISYALGVFDRQGISFDNSKLHIGYIAVF